MCDNNEIEEEYLLSKDKVLKMNEWYQNKKCIDSQIRFEGSVCDDTLSEYGCLFDANRNIGYERNDIINMEFDYIGARSDLSIKVKRLIVNDFDDSILLNLEEWMTALNM